MKYPQHKTNRIIYQDATNTYRKTQSRQHFFNPLRPVWASFATKISYIQHINDSKSLALKKKREKIEANQFILC